MKAVGIDAGGTAIKKVVIEEGKVVSRATVQSPRNNPQAFVDAIVEMAKGESYPIGISIASPYLHATGELVSPPNLPFEGLYPIKKVLEERIGHQVVVENDANAAAFGEWAMGAGRGSRVMLCLTLGTGIGGGMVIEGQLFRGAQGLAAEFGHITVDPEGPICGCGNRGCLEAMASASALERIYAHLADQGGQVVEKTNAKEVFSLACKGDPFATMAFEMVGEALGRGIASLVNALDPDTVVVGGGLSNAWEVLWPHLRGEVSRRVLVPEHRRVGIVPASLGTWGGAVGMACLAATT